jgi:hypothetical protein
LPRLPHAPVSQPASARHIHGSLHPCTSGVTKASRRLRQALMPGCPDSTA